MRLGVAFVSSGRFGESAIFFIKSSLFDKYSSQNRFGESASFFMKSSLFYKYSSQKRQKFTFYLDLLILVFEIFLSLFGMREDKWKWLTWVYIIPHTPNQFTKLDCSWMKWRPTLTCGTCSERSRLAGSNGTVLGTNARFSQQSSGFGKVREVWYLTPWPTVVTIIVALNELVWINRQYVCVCFERGGVIRGVREFPLGWFIVRFMFWRPRSRTGQHRTSGTTSVGDSIDGYETNLELPCLSDWDWPKIFGRLSELLLLLLLLLLVLLLLLLLLCETLPVIRLYR